MAKRKPSRRGSATRSSRSRGKTSRPVKRQTRRAATSRKTSKRAAAPAKRKARPAKKASKTSAKRTAGRRKSSASTATGGKRPRLERQRRTLTETVPMPPSSLNMDRHGSAVRTGRASLNTSLKEHGGMSPELTGGDVDANWENAYFSGDEAPGGDNPTPDQEVVEDIGKALGVEYADNEPLKSSDKVVERDKHRWELDPASSEDYKDRK